MSIKIHFESLVIKTVLVCVGFVLSSLTPGISGDHNGFDTRGSLVPQRLILKGGPPRDGIPTLNNPVMISAGQANYLSPQDRILGITWQENGQVYARAYPIKILNWHELVNDSFESQPYVISYCPLCGSGIAFSSIVEGQILTFGVSGLLYNSDVLLFDRETNSLWSQIMGRAISGDMKGAVLSEIPLEQTTWQKWVASYPFTSVLSMDTGYRRNYMKSPYGNYPNSEDLYFPVTKKAPKDYHPKDWVIGIRINAQTKAYPFIELEQNGLSSFRDIVGHVSVTVEWDQINKSARVLDIDGNPFPTTTCYWFAWYAFHPETEIFKVDY